jgi:hypothetical protein
MSRPNLRDLANGTISPREASHRISKAILLLLLVISTSDASSRPLKSLSSFATAFASPCNLGRYNPHSVALPCPAVWSNTFLAHQRGSHTCVQPHRQAAPLS